MNILIHLLINLLTAGVIVLVKRDKSQFQYYFSLIALGNIIDIDHLLADPIYNPARCSITTHPLHRWFAWPFEAFLFFFKKTVFIGVGIIEHLLLDGLDCLI
jgi:hypothetical protein